MTAPIPFPGMVTAGIDRKRYPYLDPGTGFVVPAESAVEFTAGVVALSNLAQVRLADPRRRPSCVGAYDSRGAWVVLGVYPTPREGEEAIQSLLTSIADDRMGARRPRR